MLIFGIVVLVLVIYCIAAYNSLVSLKTMVEEGFATMDVYLRKRWDLIPNIVSTVKGYSKHEEETLTKVIAMRNAPYSQMGMKEKIEADQLAARSAATIFALAEQYPDLKANEQFKMLNEQLSEVEEQISHARKYYNGTVRNYNLKIRMFPTNILAGMFGFTELEMFETAVETRENVKVDFN